MRESETDRSAATFLATFDIEDWFHAENLRGALRGTPAHRLTPRVERNTHRLLDVLADAGVRSTLFVLGAVARAHPGLVRRMVAEGHEVASHSDAHHRLYDLSPRELKEDLGRARETLEQITGQPVRGIRAPVFSISDAVLDVLAEAGYRYDSSYFAFGAHDRYGRLSTPIDPDIPATAVRPGLVELPLSRLAIGPAALPWAGGGYFRLLPFSVYRRGVRRCLRRRGWFMFYLHPWELDPDETPPAGLSPWLRFRAYVGRHRVERDLRRMLGEFGSIRVDEALRRRGLLEPAPQPMPPAGPERSEARP